MRLDRRDMLRTLMASLAGCWLFPTEWHSKLTVTVATPQGDVRASAVRWHQFADDPVLNAGHNKLRGEAVVVEVLPGKYLFALIDQNKPHVYSVFFPGEQPKGTIKSLPRQKGKVVMLPGGAYPMLVTFKNITDPKSVIEVKPYDRDFTEAFGPGVRLKNITLEITDDSVTEGVVVEKVIPWISDYFDRRLDGNRFGTIETNNPLANSLASGNFARRNK